QREGGRPGVRLQASGRPDDPVAGELRRRLRVRGERPEPPGVVGEAPGRPADPRVRHGPDVLRPYPPAGTERVRYWHGRPGRAGGRARGEEHDVIVVWIVVGIVVLAGTALAVSYNRFVSLRQLIRNAFAIIDSELKRRF